MKKFFLLQLITFLAAFLLFQIELIIGKVFLPNFGGSYLVWGGCVVFFQAVLLLGYVFSHYVLKKLGISRFRLIHIVITLIPLIFFPGRPLPLRLEQLGWPMMLEVFWWLTLTIGPAFFILSTMSIIWQAWLSHSDLEQRANPYALFAVSNLGSFAALLTYPFLFEMNFDLIQQQNIWRIGYGCLIILQFVAYRTIIIKSEEKEETLSSQNLSLKSKSKWFLYSAAGVMMFLAATNIITAELTPIPLFWMIPLALYLLSFVLNFKQKPYCPSWMRSGLHWILSFGLILFLILTCVGLPQIILLPLLLLFTFVVCMFCQFQIHHSRPEKQHLTYFYMIISLGGFAGGVLTTWVVPLLSTATLEYIMALWLVSLAWWIDAKNKRINLISIIYSGLLVVVVLKGPLVVIQWNYIGLLVVAVFICVFFFLLKRSRTGFIVSILALILLSNPINKVWMQHNVIYAQRNYYGVIRIMNFSKAVKMLLHGTTIHGAQFLNEKGDHIPLTYYTPTSPTGQLIIHNKEPSRIGIIGLGVGSLAIYLKAYQVLDYFELDPDIETIANEHFTFLKQSVGKVNTIIGDGRLSLEKLPDQNYKILIVDAFSGDTIPVHLVTKQALNLYKRHLDEDGVVILHITNRYIDMKKPIFKTAQEVGAYTVMKSDKDKISKVFHSDWVTLTWNKAKYHQLKEQFQWQDLAEKEYIDVRSWSDEYSTVLPYFKKEQIGHSMKKLFDGQKVFSPRTN